MNQPVVALHANLKPRREDEVNSYLAMTIVLASFAMFFASLFVAYFVLRMRQGQWPPAGTPDFPKVLPLVNTFVLLFSSVLIEMALSQIQASNNNKFKLFLSGTIFFGLAFLGLQVLLWSEVWELGLHVGTGPLGSIFYGFTVLHALHIVAGLIALLSLVPGALKGIYLEKGSLRVRMVALFWHFMDVIWILLYFAIFVF